MRIIIDKNKCIGCCACECICEAVFNVDEEVTVNDINLDDYKNDIIDAIDTCPMCAISLYDDPEQDMRQDKQQLEIHQRIHDLKALAGHQVLGINSLKDFLLTVIELAYIDGAVTELEKLVENK